MRDPDKLFAKMRKKPALQSVLDQLDQYTEDQLAQLDGQPLWIRQQLVKLKQRNGLTGSQVAEQLADKMSQTTPHPTPPATCEVRMWQGAPAFIGGGESGNFEVEIEPGDIVLLLPSLATITHGVPMGHYEAKLDSSVIKLTPSQWDVLLQSSTPVGSMTESQYTVEVQQRLALKHGI